MCSPQKVDHTSPRRAKISVRSQARMRPEQTGEISDHIGYQNGPGEIGAARKLRSTVPSSAARRLWEIWNLVLTDSEWGIGGLSPVHRSTRGLASSRDPSLHMRIVGGSLGPRVALCQAGSRTLSIEKTAKQVLERELTCAPLHPLVRVLFAFFSFAHLSRKTPFPDFSIKINHVGILLCIRESSSCAAWRATAWTPRIPGFPRLFSASRTPALPPCPQPCFREYFLGVHGHAWPLAGALARCGARFTFRETRLRRFSHPRGLLGTSSRVSNRCRDRFHNRVATVMADDVGSRPAIRDEKLFCDFGCEVPRSLNQTCVKYAIID